MRLALASFFTLLVLFGFLFSVILLGAYLLGYIEWYLLLGLTIFFNFLLWLFSPYIGDFVNKWFYKMKFIGIDGLRKIDKELADFVEKTCKKNGIKVPKIGYIPDDNPQSFTYGSASFNARIVFTQGIIEYLDSNERKAVFGHELGHIIHRDFIVMSVASTILQLMYELYWIFTRTRGKREEKSKLFIVGIISYVLFATPCQSVITVLIKKTATKRQTFELACGYTGFRLFNQVQGEFRRNDEYNQCVVLKLYFR